MRKAILLFLLFFSSQAFCQNLHFKVVNAESLEGISLAKVSSSLNKSSVTYTNAYGIILFSYLPGDTITISKNNYHSIHLYIPYINVDTMHIITVSMVPSPGDITPKLKDMSSLSMFEYHFVHKSEEKKNLKIQVFENKVAQQQREISPFKIADVHLNDFHRHKK
jgi:hypothetical protein